MLNLNTREQWNDAINLFSFLFFTAKLVQLNITNFTLLIKISNLHTIYMYRYLHIFIIIKLNYTDKSYACGMK
jgi:hypothetical protein